MIILRHQLVIHQSYLLTHPSQPFTSLQNNHSEQEELFSNHSTNKPIVAEALEVDQTTLLVPEDVFRPWKAPHNAPDFTSSCQVGVLVGVADYGWCTCRFDEFSLNEMLF